MYVLIVCNMIKGWSEKVLHRYKICMYSAVQSEWLFASDQ